MTNRVAADKPLSFFSVNGPQFTIIQSYQVPGTAKGDGAIRCVYLTNSASISGFTLTNGATRSMGGTIRERQSGGLWCESVVESVSNCVITGNSASSIGGRAVRGTLNFCTLQNNSAATDGAAATSFLKDYTLIGNRADFAGGGISGGRVTKKIKHICWAGCMFPNEVLMKQQI